MFVLSVQIKLLKRIQGPVSFWTWFNYKVATNQNALFCKLRNKKCNALFKTTCFWEGSRWPFIQCAIPGHKRNAKITWEDQLFRHGGGSLMVWGGFSLHHRTPLHRVEGNLTGIAYMDDILRPIAIPALQTVGPGAILQDDNARPHRARVVNNFLQQQQVIRMDWPSRSPNLNPVEHLWDVLGRRIRANHPPPPNLNVLFQTLVIQIALCSEFWKWEYVHSNEILSMNNSCWLMKF